MAFKMKGFSAHDTPLEKKGPRFMSFNWRNNLARNLGLRKKNKSKKGRLARLFRKGKL